jgi:ADP-dependent NAD(P)H-hydrate dehydratase / NAD(P)H-hydrate epimerase
MPAPVISVAQMREWEAATWASGQTEAAVIARVGEHLARRALELTRAGDRIIILAGKGHNGHDARAMLPHLRERNVRSIDAHDPVMAAAQFAKECATPASLIVDGLFGIGLNRPLSHDWLTLIAQINHAHAPVLAIDVPSGLDADTGEVPTAAIRANETLTVGAPKRGMLKNGAVAYVGRLVVLTDVGLTARPCASDVQWTLPEDFARFPARRVVSTHKGSFGHVGIVAGSTGFHGASVLAARGAQRARPGLITLFAQPEIYASVAAQLQAVMVAPWKDNTDLSRFTALLFGPGLAAENLPAPVADAARCAWSEFDGAVVVDASALAWLREGDCPANALRVITPHPGEAARLLGVSNTEVQDHRVASVRALSKKFGGCWVVLKGHQTVIGRTEGQVFVNCSGSAALAQGGTGDLLAGFLAGLVAQPLLRPEGDRVIRYAVWEHGAAADRLDARRDNWIVEELADELGR